MSPSLGARAPHRQYPEVSGSLREPVNIKSYLSHSGTLNWFIVLACVLVPATMLVLGIWTGMLRDANSSAKQLQRPFSMSRVQAAWWFTIIFSAYISLWIRNNGFPDLNATVLTLLGISAGTGVAAAGIDSAPTRVMPATAGFWNDISTDANGITLARVQLIAWNVALGALYAIQVYNKNFASCGGFPELNEATRGLLGISAGAYAGLKVPEKH